MGLSADKIADLRIKHLEMLQAIITRMGGYGASFKSYCITVVTAVCGFAISLQRPYIAAIALLPIFAFAMADAQYLKVERRFRGLFDAARLASVDALPTFDTSLTNAPERSFWRALFSWSIASFYTPLAIGVLIVLIGVKLING